MHKSKPKRKNDEPQNLIIRWIHTYIRWLRADFRTYRLVYFLPLLILMIMPIFYFFSGDVAEQYAHSNYILFPLLELLAGSSGIEIYTGITIIAFVVLLLKARGFLSVIVLTIPVWGLMWTIGGFIIGFSSHIMPRDSLVVDNSMYHLVSDGKSWNSSITDYMVYECDSVGIQCDLIMDIEGSLCSMYGKLELKLDNRQLQVHYVTHEEQSLQIEMDLDSKQIHGRMDC